MGGNIYLEENGIGKQAYVFRNITKTDMGFSWRSKRGFSRYLL
jgi:hypothetical protein